jgi:hypothetical protein
MRQQAETFSKKLNGNKRRNIDEDISEVKRSYRKNDEVKEVRELNEYSRIPSPAGVTAE